ncbi:hypothetical protein U6A24_20780 [Aquimarina gracilis]|uniref:Dienelactone hydrolase family protein n=1 Tax=Aquimarina gracilis TaxID=874422 RepID=A0ABU6A190_9FLAO|nr:hypothetical protein [Aquimarina gracilis]MEB3347923.1 hypothetical protein [Aquimarina gracilis]
MESISKYFFVFVMLSILIGCKNKTSTENTEGVETNNENQTELPLKIKSEEVSYKADSLQMKGYLAFNENATEKSPGIIVVHEWWGHNNYV